MSALALYLLMLKATLLSFSGFASVPVIREDLVTARAILTDEQLNNAIAISQASPGPLGLYMVIVGYFVGGIHGAAAGVLALATPAMLALPLLRAIRRGNDTKLRAAYSAIVISSCALMAVTSMQLAPGAVSSLALLIVAGVGCAVLALTSVPPVAIVVGAAFLGSML
jgi:chromate transporter